MGNNELGILIVFSCVLAIFGCRGDKGAEHMARPAYAPLCPKASETQAAAIPDISSQPLLLLENPSLSQDKIAFAYAGEIWAVPRQGGQARRLVTGEGRLGGPSFSPDGSLLAFTGTYDGNTDVYVVSSCGGSPQRLTYHPERDIALGWTPDGQKVLFRSPRATRRDLDQLYTVPVTGGPPTMLPLPSAYQASFSADGAHLAYIPFFMDWQPAWKQYRGGTTARIWIANLADSSVIKIPRENSNDKNPIWVGDQIFFLSDRDGPVTLYSYDTKTKVVKKSIANDDGFDIYSASAGPGAIVYHQFGRLYLFDLASGQSKLVPVTVTADLPQLRPSFAAIEGPEILHAAISPTGKRALFEARGDILSAPAEKGDLRNLTDSPGVADRDPAWSPDGKLVAWFSDESGEYALHLRSPGGLGEMRKIDLGEPPSFFYSPRWSPDSSKIAFTDKRMNLWVVDLDRGAPKKIDTDLFDTPFTYLDPAWSPDSRWIAYTKQLQNHLHAIFIYSLETGKIQQVTDGRSESYSPRFDRGGKYLYFLASTNTALSMGWLDMTSMGRVTTSNAYAVVLQNDIPSPAAPESDEEGQDPKEAEKEKETKGDESADADKAPKPEKKPTPIRIDFDGIDQRIVALPIPRANYGTLETGAEGVIYLLSYQLAFADEDYLEYNEEIPVPENVVRFDLKTRKTEKFVDGIDGSAPAYGGLTTFLVSADGSKVLFSQQRKWYIVPGEKAPAAGEGQLKTALEVRVDPRAEWRQMYREVWRIERDFLYDPGFHGLDLCEAAKVYEPFIDGIGSRDALNALFTEMTGHLVLGHVYVWGGAQPKQNPVNVGLLGADYRVVDGRYQFARIFTGENWNPKLTAPLTQPGVVVKEGEFLLAVNGQDLKGEDDIYRLFQNTANRQTALTVAASSDGKDSRNVTVVPIASEREIRLRAWMEDNRRKVDELTGGRVAYVYLPDTFAGGFANFNRYYFSQIGKEAVILDERFNHGGSVADYIIDQLRRTPQMAYMAREGEDVMSPEQTIPGPKVMIINEMSGSGGDAMPWLFRKAGLGPLIGTRTWGGLVGIGGYPSLIDGGGVTAPRWGLYSIDGTWDVENKGVAPDIEVEQDPALVRQGRDPQLERAVKEILSLLAKNPPPKIKRPSPPKYHTILPRVKP
jgi:tricorn protease